jgi:hypothetical protein
MTARLVILALSVVLSVAPSALRAQRIVRAGSGSVSTPIRVGLVIPPRLRLRVATPPQLQQQRADTATYAMVVEVAANLPWTLGVVGADLRGADDGAGAEGANGADAPTLRVQDHTGTWRTLGGTEGLVTLVPSRAPGSWLPVRLELQVVGRQRALPGVTFDLQAASR